MALLHNCGRRFSVRRTGTADGYVNMVVSVVVERVTKNQRGYYYTCGIQISSFDHPEMCQVRFLPTGGEMAVSHLELMFPGTQ